MKTTKNKTSLVKRGNNKGLSSSCMVFIWHCSKIALIGTTIVYFHKKGMFRNCMQTSYCLVLCTWTWAHATIELRSFYSTKDISMFMWGTLVWVIKPGFFLNNRYQHCIYCAKQFQSRYHRFILLLRLSS